MTPKLHHSLGDLIGYLDKNDLTKNTLFFLISDNGMAIHSDPWWGGLGGKTSIAEMGLRSPFLVRWDGQVAPGDYDHPVSSIDLVPTLLTAAGVDFSDAKLPSLDLIALAKAGHPAAPRPVFSENFNPNPKVVGAPEETVVHRSVRFGDFKLISPENTARHADLTQGWPKPEVKKPNFFTDLRLHNLRTDPGERTNLANDPSHAAKRDELLALLNEWWPLKQ